MNEPLVPCDPGRGRVPAGRREPAGAARIPVRTLPAAVLVVDDSAVVRRLVCDAIAAAPDLAVACAR